MNLKSTNLRIVSIINEDDDAFVLYIFIIYISRITLVAWLFTIILSLCSVVLVLSLRRCVMVCMSVCERVLYL